MGLISAKSTSHHLKAIGFTLHLQHFVSVLHGDNASFIAFVEFFTLFLPKDHLREILGNNYYNYYYTTCLRVWQMACIIEILVLCHNDIDYKFNYYF